MVDVERTALRRTDRLRQRRFCGRRRCAGPRGRRLHGRLGGTHTVTAESWVAAFPPDTDGFVYTATCLISQMNENEGFLVCENDGQSTWSRYDWMRTGDTLYYCQIEFAAAEEDTAAANDSADRSDVEAGCSGYAWTLLTPAD